MKLTPFDIAYDAYMAAEERAEAAWGEYQRVADSADDAIIAEARQAVVDADQTVAAKRAAAIELALAAVN